MTTVTISLPDSLMQFVDTQGANKGYDDFGEYILSLVRETQATGWSAESRNRK